MNHISEKYWRKNGQQSPQGGVIRKIIVILYKE